MIYCSIRVVKIYYKSDCILGSLRFFTLFRIRLNIIVCGGLGGPCIHGSSGWQEGRSVPQHRSQSQGSPSTASCHGHASAGDKSLLR